MYTIRGLLLLSNAVLFYTRFVDENILIYTEHLII